MKVRGKLCIHCLDYHIEDFACETKTCFKCGRVGHLVSQCVYKFDKLTCFKCGKKGHKIYDCQILIVPSSSYSTYTMEREVASLETQRRGWMKEEIKKARCVQCGTLDHQYCTNDHHLECQDDRIYDNKIAEMFTARELFSSHGNAVDRFDEHSNYRGSYHNIPGMSMSPSTNNAMNIFRNAGNR